MPILSKVWSYVAGFALLFIGLAAAIFGIRRSGEKAAEVDATDKALEQAKDSNAIDKAVRADSDDALASKLREYQRD